MFQLNKPFLILNNIKLSLIIHLAIVVGLAQEEYTVSEDGSLRVCAALNQTTSRRVVVRVATVESATPNSDLSRAQGTFKLPV